MVAHQEHCTVLYAAASVGLFPFPTHSCSLFECVSLYVQPSTCVTSTHVFYCLDSNSTSPLLECGLRGHRIGKIVKMKALHQQKWGRIFSFFSSLFLSLSLLRTSECTLYFASRQQLVTRNDVFDLWITFPSQVVIHNSNCNCNVISSARLKCITSPTPETCDCTRVLFPVCVCTNDDYYLVAVENSFFAK